MTLSSVEHAPVAPLVRAEELHPRDPDSDWLAQQWTCTMRFVARLTASTLEDSDVIRLRRRRECEIGETNHRHGVYCGDGSSRSEEHTSELQSLMRISYAVFCLKKTQDSKKKERNITTQYHKHTL